MSKFHLLIFCICTHSALYCSRQYAAMSRSGCLCFAILRY